MIHQASWSLWFDVGIEKHWEKYVEIFCLFIIEWMTVLGYLFSTDSFAHLSILLTLGISTFTSCCLERQNEETFVRIKWRRKKEEMMKKVIEDGMTLSIRNQEEGLISKVTMTSSTLLCQGREGKRSKEKAREGKRREKKARECKQRLSGWLSRQSNLEDIASRSLISFSPKIRQESNVSCAIKRRFLTKTCLMLFLPGTGEEDIPLHHPFFTMLLTFTSCSLLFSLLLSPLSFSLSLLLSPPSYFTILASKSHSSGIQLEKDIRVIRQESCICFRERECVTRLLNKNPRILFSFREEASQKLKLIVFLSTFFLLPFLWNF